jgi:hypothetical protein
VESKLKGFLSELQGFTEVNHNREQGQGQDTKSQWGTESKIAKVANILRLN